MFAKGTTRASALIGTLIVALGWAGVAQGQEVSITIGAANTSVSVGQPIPIDVQLKNTSDHAIGVGRVGGERNGGIDYHVILLASNGRAVPRTKYGAAVDTGRVEGSAVLLQLKPGETLTQSFDLTKLFKLTEPGTYTLRAGRKLPERTGKMEWSNTLTLTVTE